MESIYKLCFYGGLALAIIFLIASVVLFIVLKIPKVIGDLTGRNAKKSIDAMKNRKAASSEVSRKEQAKYYNQGTGKIKVKDAVSPATRKSNRDDTTDLLDSKKPGREFAEDETEVLGAGKYRASEDETEVLGAGKYADSEEKTDVLRADGSLDGEEATDVLTSENESNDEDTTDVLRADTSDDEEATDVLRADTSDDEEATDVLRADTSDDEEATDVLRATAATEEDDDEPATDVLRTETITPKKKHSATVIYDIVITHTEEKI